jgi:poly(3-hydroxybutyrate) depolymerase
MVANLPPDQVAESGMRRYWVRLPLTYDHTRAYPIVFYGPGCGASGVEGTPMMDTIKNDAIHVFLIGTGSCFDTGSYPTPEVPYFNQVLDEVQAKYCTDASKVFVSGYSSGGWLSHDLACGVGDRIRGIGSAAGGLTKSITDGYDCASKPKVAGILYTGANDNTNPANSIDPVTGFNKGVAGARDRLILANGCDMNAMEPWPNTLGVDYCQMWKTGCEDNPVVYCVGPGDGHGNGGIISQKGWWEFWMSLP